LAAQQITELLNHGDAIGYCPRCGDIDWQPLLDKPGEILFAVFLLVEDKKVWRKSENRCSIRVLGAPNFREKGDPLRRVRAVFRHTNDAVAGADGEERFCNARNETDNALQLVWQRNLALQIIKDLHEKRRGGTHSCAPMI
jgi:hypothetical protein